MDKLKPCPFCGSDAELKKISDRWTVKCTNECAGTRIFNDKNRAVLAWNARAEEPNEPLTLDELKQMKGEQVYVTRLEAGKERQNTIGCGWYEVRDEHLYSISKAIYFEVIENFFGWRAYRHKPKEAD